MTENATNIRSGTVAGVGAILTERQSRIVGLARETGRVGVEDLALAFDVTPQTIRRDLNELCALRLLTRIHGGAIVASSVRNLAYAARRLINAEEKRAIASAAARLIPNACSLFINVGTTTEEVAAALMGHENLLVITNNLHVAMMLYPHPTMEVITAGGPVRRQDGAVIGTAAVEFIKQFKVDVAVIGVSALDEDGALLDFDTREVNVARAIIENARKVILVGDRMKLERSAPIRIAHISQIHTFVTDRLASSKLRAVCDAHRVDVVEALPEPTAEDLASD